MGKLEELIQRIEDNKLRQEILVEMKRRELKDPGPTAGEVLEELRNGSTMWKKQHPSMMDIGKSLFPIQQMPPSSLLIYLKDPIPEEENNVDESEDGEEVS